MGKGAEPGRPLCRPGVPVPEVMRHGISDSQTKDLAQSVTVYVNKLLGALPSSFGLARVFFEEDAAGS